MLNLVSVADEEALPPTLDLHVDHQGVAGVHHTAAITAEEDLQHHREREGGRSTELVMDCYSQQRSGFIPGYTEAITT